MPVDFALLPPTQHVPDQPLSRYAQAAVGYKGVDHGGAYQNLPQQKFALWGIVKTLKNVAGTPLEYTA
jgi:hypothetical protein